ncbi:LPS-assembly protein LptD [Pseudaestuariivita atlantica]|uniref:LPS-assembly protein LptD n=1 Tax=Pseudaestuariivita atlantica TaxID=1317121 RepID=A0A0L1JKS3_9RHOB|nr:LPS assembly protein LptD [Pseudaestuariivita atlantica]KNG92359.1 organic solvent tolerance protein [Pseudaestuariivita atlantica]
MRALRHIAAALLAACLALPLAAQDAGPPPSQSALLVADAVLLEGETRLIATGNVQALQDGTILYASRVIYDRTTDTIIIEGPIRIEDPNGTILIADQAELSQDLQNGILNGARVVLDQQLQLAAAQLQRVGGRYTQLSKVAATSCQVCGPNAVPLWQIRAKRAVHDQEARQVYFENAQFRVLDLPVFYLPRLRLPDPTLKRARGFLFPSIRQTSLLGLGIKVPYFIPIGDHRDLTITPYLSQNTRTFELRYRQAFRAGRVEFNGAISNDTLKPDTRAYLFGEGSFDLNRDFKLAFDVEVVSDRTYLDDYDYGGKSRLDSEVALTRVSRDALFDARLVHFQSLRAGEDNTLIPSIAGDLVYQRRYFPMGPRGGELRLDLAGHSHYRSSTTDILGRDVSRMTGAFSWRNRWTLPGGLRAGLTGELAFDATATEQDSTRTPTTSDLSPAAAVELRWPWTMRAANGARHLIEPVAMIGWTGGERPDTANDESDRVEFDEGNLLSLSRFPATDRRERGRQAAVGVRWLMHDADGWSTGLTVARVFRDTADPEFSRSSGLGGTSSDWLIAGQIRSQGGLSFTARGLLDSDQRFSKAEARADLLNDRWNLGASYVLLVQDPAENRASAISEWSLDGAYRVTRYWTVSTDFRYDLVSDQFARAEVGLGYQNECVEVDFSAQRRFTSSSNATPSTSFGLTVALKGFSTGGSARDYRRSCKY